MKDASTITAVICLSAVAAGAAALGLKPAAAQSQSLPFLQADRCYRLTFPITGAPNWRVLEVRDDGWIRAEVDAGPAAAKRESVWVNTAQIITVREARCSE